MKLIIGLGNPGNEYKKTRHNIGFLIIDKLAEQYNVQLNKKKFAGLYGDFLYKNEKVMLLKPYNYINLSGETIKMFIDYFKIKIDDILVICDDLNLVVGQLKLKESGSSGGHNGLKNIEYWLNTQHYKRLKIGISKNELIATKDYVLGQFTNEEWEIMQTIIIKSSNIINDYLEVPFSMIMNKYNRKNKG